MGIIKHLKAAWRKPPKNLDIRNRLIEWRRQPVCLRVEQPSRLDRAHALG